MKPTKTTIASISVILLSFAVSLWFWPQMPEQMATHWGMQGEVNGYLPKFWGLFLMPLITAGLGFILWAVPRIDPLKANIVKFKKYYNGFIVVILVFMLAVHLQILFFNLGVKISPNRFLPVGFGFLFFYSGILIQNAKPNWFVGIRTPWTLSNERVWAKTHSSGGKLFKIAGVITLAGYFFPGYAFWFILVPVIAVVLFTFIYSYYEYRKESPGD